MGSWGFGPLDNDNAQDWLADLGLARKVKAQIWRFLKTAEANEKYNAKRSRTETTRHRANYIVDETVAALYIASLTSSDLLGGAMRIPHEDVVKIFRYIHRIDRDRGWKDLKKRSAEMAKLERHLLHHEGLARLGAGHHKGKK